MPRRKRRYWLVKTEPDVYSIDDLAREGVAEWDGVRNYQARNLIRDEMAVGDLVLVYHSSVAPPGVVGIARVAAEAHPDPTAWDENSPYFDPKSEPENPRWWLIDLEFVEAFAELVSLETLKSDPDLTGMLVTRRGQRLSVQPVDKAHFVRVLRLARASLRVR